MSQKPFDLTLIIFQDHDPPFACERCFEHRAHLPSAMNTERLDKTRPPGTCQTGRSQSNQNLRPAVNELSCHRLRRERRFGGGEGESVHLSIGRGCR